MAWAVVVALGGGCVPGQCCVPGREAMALGGDPMALGGGCSPSRWPCPRSVCVPGGGCGPGRGLATAVGIQFPVDAEMGDVFLGKEGRAVGS